MDGDGHDAGVVYSEMQARENDPELLMFLRSKRLLYPEGVGFRHETFGVMESLRALSADRIRQYHRETYQPKNLCIIIIGEVDHAGLLSTLEQFEDSMENNTTSLGTPFHRPWIDSRQAPPLQKSIKEVVVFPEEDESSGQITISFFGPPYLDHLLCQCCLAVLSQ